MKPKVSVLVPIYNVEQYLVQCLSSIVDQTLQELEIICINDGSTDNSLTIVKEFARNDARIKIIDKKNSGYGDSMNLGLKKAQGEYIGIVEPDDWIEPVAFEQMYLAAKAVQVDGVNQNNKAAQDDTVNQTAKLAPADVVKTNFYRCKTSAKNGVENQPVAEITEQEVINPRDERKVFRFAPAIWSAIYRRKFLEDNQIDFLPTPGASYQDLSFSFKVWTLARKVVLLPEAYVHYRVDNENSSVNDTKKINCVVDEYAEIETFLCERGIFADFGTTMNAAKFRNYHWNFQRLGKTPAKEFYQTWRQELLSAWEEGLLKREDFSTKDWVALKTIIKHPRMAYRVLRMRRALKRFLRK